MAKCTVELPDEFLVKLSRLGKRSDEIAEKALQAGGEVMLDKVRENLASVVGQGENSRSTGELQASLGLTPVLVDRDGNSNIKVGFAEPRSDGDSNAKIANILEYGRHGQPARPFLKPAKTAAVWAYLWKRACFRGLRRMRISSSCRCRTGSDIMRTIYRTMTYRRRGYLCIRRATISLSKTRSSRHSSVRSSR